MIKIASVALALLLAGPAFAEKAVIIDDDGGGEVDTYLSWYQRLKASGVPVVLRGICESACGFVLMLPPKQVCVESTASLGFHLATSGHTPMPDYSAALFRRYTPASVQHWLSDKTLTSMMIFMTADEIVSLGVFPACHKPGDDF
jgi:hypothetical protein